jgi:hypothetical protein
MDPNGKVCEEKRYRKHERRGLAAPPQSKTTYAAGIIFFIRSAISEGDTSST